MYRFQTLITDQETGNTVEAYFRFDSRKSARHWARRNIRRGWVHEAVLFHDTGRVPLAAWWATIQDGDYVYVSQNELLSA